MTTKIISDINSTNVLYSLFAGETYCASASWVDQTGFVGESAGSTSSFQLAFPEKRPNEFHLTRPRKI
jgi:hypothetical protein